MMKFILAVAFLLLSVSVTLAGTEIWDIYCTVDYAYEGDEPVTLFNLPDGNGSSFSEARLPDGTFVDATLRVRIQDHMGDPVPNFPAEDMWLDTSDGGLVACPGGISADSNTDEDGWTVWAEPMNAGGFTTGMCTMFINGMTALGWVDLDLRFNSADMNGDGIVNLQDVASFSTAFYGVYSFAADFSNDGVLGLQDVALLAVGMGSSCP